MKFRIYDDTGEFCVNDVKDHSDSHEALLCAVDELISWTENDEDAWELYDEDERDSHVEELEHFKQNVKRCIYDTWSVGGIVSTSLGFTIEVIE